MIRLREEEGRTRGLRADQEEDPVDDEVIIITLSLFILYYIILYCIYNTAPTTGAGLEEDPVDDEVEGDEEEDRPDVERPARRDSESSLIR